MARLWGYDELPTTIRSASVAPSPPTPELELVPKLGAWLVGLGMQEVITPSMVAPERLEQFPHAGKPVELANPSSADMSVMRTHLLPSLLEVARHNFAHKSVSGVAIYETGFTYRELPDGSYEQIRQVGMLLTGEVGGGRWDDYLRGWDFYDLRGFLETLVKRCSDEPLEIVHYGYEEFSREAGAKVLLAGEEVGRMGLVRQDIAEAYDLSRPAFYGQLNVAALAAMRRTETLMKPLPRFPAMEFDLALVVAESIPAHQVEAIIWKHGGQLMRSVILFDVYRGAGLRDTEKSLGFRLQFRADDRTLTDRDVEGNVQKIISAATKEVDARIRT